MDKLTLEHLAPYLPYGLKTEKGLLWAICNDNLAKNKLSDGEIVKGKIENIRPILRPLSDLDKVITIGDESFRLSTQHDLVKDENDDWCDEFSADYAESPACLIPVTNMNLWLFKYHFDVFGLIDAGLAIDINTIKK